jgi:formylglycine-generating enzyme required for sulfatase activity
MPRQYFYVCFLVLLAFGCKRREIIAPINQPHNQSAEAAAGPAKQILPITNMVPIKAGSFMRGKFRVTLTHDFWIGKYEVTQGEYVALMTNNPSNFDGDPNRPVEKVKFNDAQAYCDLLTKRESAAGHIPSGYSYRLPTEAEWEYACRAGTTNQYSFGEDPKLADDYVWYLENSEGSTHPVGQKKPNPWGLYDMHGNVWEWCSDWFAPFAKKDETDPVGPPTSKFKVFHGGGWNHAIEFARPGNRIMMPPDNGIHFVGFRVVLGVNLPTPKATAASPK